MRRDRTSDGTGHDGSVQLLKVSRRKPMAARRRALRPFLDTLEDRVTPAVVTWSGAINNLWTNPGNWGGTAPAPGDDLVFPSGAQQLTSVNNFAPGLSFGSVTIEAAGYDILGNAITLTGAGFSPTPVLATFTAGSSRYDLDTTLVNSNVRVAPGGRLDFSGAVAGSVGLTISGLAASPDVAGTVSLTGPTNNSFTGPTVVNAGTLELFKTGAAAAVPGPLTIGDGTGSDLVNLLGGNQIADGGVVTINSSGQLSLGGFTDVVGGLNLTAGTVNLQSGTLTLNGDVTTNAATTTSSILGPGTLGLGNATRTFTVADGVTDPDLTITGTISGSGTAGLIKDGGGRLLLGAANTFAGLTDVTAGRLSITNSAGLGTTAAGTVVRSGASLLLGNGVNLAGEALDLSGTGVGTTGSLVSESGGSGVAGTITLSADAAIGTLPGTNLLINGQITDGTVSFSLTKVGTGLLTLTNANPYDGGTTISAGLVAISNGGALGSGAASVANGATLAIVGGHTVANPLTIDGLGSSGQGALDVGSGDNALTGGVTLGASATTQVNVISAASLAVGTIGVTIPTGSTLRKGGTGLLSLNAAAGIGNGGLDVTAGRLNVNAAYANNAVSLSGGILGGTGTVGAITSTGTVADSIQPGLLTPVTTATLSSGNLAMSANTTFVSRLGGTTAGAFDQIAVTGTVNLAGASLSLSLLPAYTPAGGNVLTLISNDGTDAVTGTFNGLPGGSIITVGSAHFRISYVGGDGNDVTLSFVEATTTTLISAPNPSAFGQAITLTATVTPGSGTLEVGGTVSFYAGAAIGGTLLGVSPVNALTGIATLSGVTSLPVGPNQTLTAVFSGTNAFTGSEGTTNHTVNRATTTTVVTTSLVAGAIYGETITFTATVTPGTGVGPTGTVEFRNITGGAPGTLLGQGTLNASGVATFSTSNLAVGMYTIGAFYLGDTNFETSNNSVAQAVFQAQPTITLVVSPSSPTVFGQPVTLTATIAPEFAGTITGVVTFLNGASSLGNAPVTGTGTPTDPFIATLTVNNLPVGSLNLDATYDGDLNNAPAFLSVPLPFTVNQGTTTTTVVSSANPSIFGNSVTFTATVTPSAPSTLTPTGNVIFVIDGTPQAPVAVDATGMATFTTSTLAVGAHTVVANYAGSIGYAASGSTTLNQQVNQATTTTTLVAVPTSSQYGNTVALTATVAVTAGAGTPTGQVNFFYSSGGPFLFLGTGTLSGTSPFAATYTTTATQLPAGTLTLRATYVGAPSFATSTGDIASYVVSKADTATLFTIAPPTGTAAFGDPVTFTVTVSATSPGTPGLPPDGSVVEIINVTNGDTVVATGTIVNGVAVIATSTLPAGTNDYAARFVATSNFEGSRSASQSYEVLPAVSVTTIVSSPNPSRYGQTVTFVALVRPSNPLLPTPTGIVEFTDGLTLLGTGALDASGLATFSTSDLSVGSHDVVARFLGDLIFDGSESDPVTQVVERAITTAVLTVAPNPAVYGQSVTLTAYVSVPDTGTPPAVARSVIPVGDVEFFDGSTSLGFATLDANGLATLTIATTDLISPIVGLHDLTAVYAQTESFESSSSPTTTLTVEQALSNVVVTAAPSPSVIGQSVTFTVTVGAVAPGVGTPTGTVELFDGATLLGVATLTNGVATVTTSALLVGTHPMSAVYTGDANFAAGVSPTTTHVVQMGTTTTLVVSTPNPSVYGQLVTFTATVAASAPAVGQPTGGVLFLIDGAPVGLGVLVNGTATFSTSSLPVGTSSITAAYVGSPDFASSISGSINQTVDQASTGVSLVSSSNPSVYGQVITISVTVLPIAPGAGMPTGFVSISVPGVADAELVNGMATFTLPADALGLGITTILVDYAGDANFAASFDSIDQEVLAATTTTTLIVSPSTTPYGSLVTLEASVVSVEPGVLVPTGTVEFFDGLTSLGTANVVNGLATLFVSATTPPLEGTAVGAHSITAVFTPDGAEYIGSTADPVELTVQQAQTSGLLAVTPNPSAFGQEVTITVLVSPIAPGAGTPTGDVEIFDGLTSLGTVTLIDGVATFATSTLSVGLHTLTASYYGDDNFAGFLVSNAVVQVVQMGTTTTVSSSDPNPSVYGELVTFTATVAVVSPASGTPTGEVLFLADGAPIGLGTLSGLTATFSTSSLPVGTTSITARYLGDADFHGSTSLAIDQMVGQASTGVSLVSSSNPSVYGQVITISVTVLPIAPGAGMPTGFVSISVPGVADAELVNGMATFTLPADALGLGITTIFVDYAGDANFAASFDSIDQEVLAATTTSTLIVSPSTTTFGGPITLTVTVTADAPSALTPTGTVEFFDGSTSLGTADVIDGVATLLLSANSPLLASPTVGLHDITAVFTPDIDGFLASTSEVQTLTVDQAITTTMIASLTNPTLFGQEATFVITVSSSSPGAGTPTGEVEIFDGLTSLGTRPLTGGVATFATSTLSVGGHSMRAVYLGTANFAGSSSSALTHVVLVGTTTTTVATSVSPTVYGQSVTFTATVAAAAPAAGTPSGTVVFFANGAAIGSGTLVGGTATFSTSSLPVGTSSITASYLGNANFGGGLSQAINQIVGQAATGVLVTSSVNPSAYGQPATLTIIINPIAPGAGMPTGSVSITLPGADPVIVTLVAGQATYTIPALALPVGTSGIEVAYLGDTNFQGSTTTFDQEVIAALTTTVVTSAPNPSSFGQSVTFTVTVSPVPPGSGVPTGMVELFDGETSLGTAELTDGLATFTIDTLSAGSHTITASYFGSVEYETSTSAAITQVVSQATTSGVVTSNSPTVFGMPITFTATFTSPGGEPTGSVTFFDGVTELGSADLVDGVATFLVMAPGLSAGSHAITASYAGNENFAGSVTPVAEHVVERSASVTSLVVAPTPSTFGQVVTLTATVEPGLLGVVQLTNGGSVRVPGQVVFYNGTTVIGLSTLIDGVATFTTSTLTPGVHGLRAEFLGSGNYLGSVSESVSHLVNRGTPQVSISSLQNPTGLDQTATFVALVTASGAVTPTGTVAFVNGSGVILGYSPLDATTHQAVFATSTLPVGTNLIYAVYVGDPNFAAVASTAVSQTVVTVSGVPTSAFSIDVVNGQAIFFTNNRTPSFAGSAPAGYTVRVFATPTAGGPQVLLGSTLADTSGNWTLTSSTALADGLYSFAAQLLDMPVGTRVATASSMGLMQIDTVAPVVTSIMVNPSSGQVFIAFADASGLIQSNLVNPSFYSLIRPNLTGPNRVVPLTNVFTQRPASLSEGQAVGLTFNNGAVLPSSRYQISVIPWIIDRAGNQLSGRFTGTLPTSPANPGTPFVALYDINGARVTGPKVSNAPNGVQPVRAPRVPSGPAFLTGRGRGR